LRAAVLARLRLRRASACVGGAALCISTLAPHAASGQGSNLRLGPLELDLAGSGAVEYNSNINHSGTDPRWDIIWSAGISVTGVWQMTQYNELRVRVGARFDKYTRHPELDSHRNFLILSPETEFTFQVRVRELEMQFFDRVEFSSSAADVRAVDPDTGDPILNVLAFNRLENRAGMLGRWELNPYWQLSFGGDRLDVVPWEREFESLRRWQHTGRLGLHHDIAANMNASLLGTVFENTYRRPIQPDSRGYTVGGELGWDPTELTSLSATLMWTAIDFDAEMGARDDTDTARLTGSLGASHAMNRFYNHELEYRHDVDFGFVSNTIIRDTVRYRAFFLGFQRTRVEGNVTWTRGRESGGFLPEAFTRWESGLLLRYSFMRDMRVHFRYRYATKSSNIAERAYDQHSVSVGFTYDF